VIAAPPTVKLTAEAGRELTIDSAVEAELLVFAKQPMSAAILQLSTVAKQFWDACCTAHLNKSLVLVLRRNTFGTAAYEATGNLAMVMKPWAIRIPAPRCIFNIRL
jgi:hypothetical protein